MLLLCTTLFHKDYTYKTYRKRVYHMSSEAQKKAYKTYNKKKINFAVVYTPTDRQEGERLKKYINSNNMSANSYIKQLIKNDLDSKGIPYPD